MKRFIAGMLIAGSGLLTLNSCKKTENMASPVTPVSTIKVDPSLSIFSTLESRSGDDAYVNGSPVILAPVDSAFVNAGITQTVAASLSPAECDSIVKYYTFSNPVVFNNSSDTELPFPTLLGPSVFADSTTGILYFNGISAVSSSPVITGSTSIYKLTQFMNLPVASIAQIAAADTSLSMFNEAFNIVNQASGGLSGTPFTLFMPTNTAFINAGYPDIASIDAADITTLTKLILYHAVPNEYFDNDLAKQTTLTTLQSGSIQVNTNGGVVQLIGNADPSLPATVLNNGIFAGKVLTYKISNVLLP